MPRGTPVNWDRELLEQVEVTAGSVDMTVLAERIGCAPATLYSIKGRIASEGIDEILEKQSQRYQSYTRGGAKRPETLEEQLSRVYLITVAAAGRGGGYPQYGVSIPATIALPWVERWGRQVRFVPTEDGLLIQPVEPSSLPPLPAWMNGATEG